MRGLSEIEQQIRFRAIRPLDAALPVYSDDDHFLQGSVDLRDDPKQRISSVLIYFGRRSPAEKLDDLKNYAVRYLQADPDAAGANQYGSNVIKRINSRWLLSTSLGRVQDLADALLVTFRDPPRILSFAMDPRHDLRVGDIFRAKTRYLQAVDGSNNQLAFEVIEAQEERAGHLIRYRAQSMPADIPLVGEYSIVFSTDEFDVVLYDVFVSEYGAPSDAVSLAVSIQSGVLISATSTAIPAFKIGAAWPTGSTITITNEGTIAGRGGSGGGYLVGFFSYNGTPGENGGLGLYADYPVTIDNSTGVIAGGGGGGGQGSSDSSPCGTTAGGGGGGGAPNGAAGSSMPGSGNNGAAGTVAGGGGGGAASGPLSCPPFGTFSGGAGGDGGSYGQPGDTGTTGTYGSGGAGGGAGDCVNGNSNITWTATGTRHGSIT